MPASSPRPLYSAPREQKARHGVWPGTAASMAKPAGAAAEAPAQGSLTTTRVNTFILVGILALGASLVVTAWAAGSNPVALVLAVVFACTAQGWWRGGAEVAGLLVGTVTALLLAPSVGPLLDGPVSSMLGTTGLQTRAFSIVLTFVAVMLAITMAAGVGARRWMKHRPLVLRWNRVLGGGIGLVEGSLLGLAVLWVPLALDPVARARLGAGDDHAGARGVVEFARQVRASALGSLAERTSPLHGSEILAMAEDFAIVSRSRRAMAFFVEQPVMRRLQEAPSVTGALERLRQDPDLREMFSQSSAVTSQALLALMRSQAVVEVLDGTPIVSDLRPQVPEIAAALRAAKDVALAEAPAGE